MTMVQSGLCQLSSFILTPLLLTHCSSATLNYLLIPPHSFTCIAFLSGVVLFTHTHCLDNSCIFWGGNIRNANLTGSHSKKHIKKSKARDAPQLVYQLKKANKNQEFFHLLALPLVSGLWPQGNSTQGHLTWQHPEAESLLLCKKQGDHSQKSSSTSLWSQ